MLLDLDVFRQLPKFLHKPTRYKPSLYLSPQVEQWLRQMESQLEGQAPLKSTLEEKKSQLHNYKVSAVDTTHPEALQTLNVYFVSLKP